MREINFDFNIPKIKINGDEFELHKTDIEICEIVNRIPQEIGSLAEKNEQEILEACKKVANYIDSILGDGALLKVTKGKPISIVKQIELLTLIAKESTMEYTSYIEENYLTGNEND